MIKLLHYILLTGLISSVFIKKLMFKIFCLFAFLYLLIRYISGNDRCGLIMLEEKITGKNGNVYSFIKPIISCPDNYFNSYIIYFHIFFILILLVQISFYCYNKIQMRKEEICKKDKIYNKELPDENEILDKKKILDEEESYEKEELYEKE